MSENQLKNLTPDDLLSDPTVRRSVLSGSPSAALTNLAKTYNADLLVLGAHGYGPVEKYFVGTTTDKVLSRAICPILTVKL
jgi:nucleotide-binding universal stress UspA family protein